MKITPVKITKSIFKMLICAATAFFLTASASDQVPAPPQQKPIALINADIYTVAKGVIENGSLLFENGKIKTMGFGIVSVKNDLYLIVTLH